ncbi:MAG: hypothetical protein AAF725_21025, partial [Acidobacteriota bacterium]
MRLFSRRRTRPAAAGGEDPSSAPSRAPRRPLEAGREVYAEKALEQIPRLLEGQDRSPLSPTYGCFHRGFWLDGASDSPDAVRQVGAHALALVYRHDFPGSPYRGQATIRDWAIAGLDYWQRIQHRDGSFDESYPFERGWLWPTAYTTFASIEAHGLLEGEIPFDVSQRVLSAIRRSAAAIAADESEEEPLVSHRAAACLAVWKAYELLGDPALEEGFERLWRSFMSRRGGLQDLEAADPGALTATVSFLSRILETRPSAEMRRAAEEGCRMAAYFISPNGGLCAGSPGALPYHPRGVEWLGTGDPLARALAAKLRQALGDGALVPLGQMPDRALAPRVPEFLEAYLACPVLEPERASFAAEDRDRLPFQRDPFVRYFEDARLFVSNDARRYAVANLAKGGVVEIFDRRSGALLLGDRGWVGRLADGRVVTSQWLDPDLDSGPDLLPDAGSRRAAGFTVRGRLRAAAPSQPLAAARGSAFRVALLLTGWSGGLSRRVKASVRRALDSERRRIGVRFSRRLRLLEDRVEILDAIEPDAPCDFRSLSVGGEFCALSASPRGGSFRLQELQGEAEALAEESLESLRAGERVELRRILEISAQDPWRESRVLHASAGQEERAAALEYLEARRSRSRESYRLQRRIEEVAAALDRHAQGGLDLVLDLGAADGAMLEALAEQLEIKTAVGAELSLSLVSSPPAGARALPLRADALEMPVAAGVA